VTTRLSPLATGLMRLFEGLPEVFERHIATHRATCDRLNALAGLPQGTPPEEALQRVEVELLRLRFEASVWGPQRAALGAEAERLRTGKRRAFEERNRVVVALAHLAIGLGWRAGVGTHVDVPGQAWDAAWRTLVVIDLPVGQVSWHLHDEHAFLVEGLPRYTRSWDGHSTEVKYNRLARLADVAGEVCRGGRLDALNALARCAASWSHARRAFDVILADLRRLQESEQAPLTAVQRAGNALGDAGRDLAAAEANLDRAVGAIV